MAEGVVQSGLSLTWRIVLFVVIVPVAVICSFAAEALVSHWLSPRLSEAFGRFVMMTISFGGAFVVNPGPFPHATPGRRVLYTLLLGSVCAAFGVAVGMLLFP
jgi:hypothetical protein